VARDPGRRRDILLGAELGLVYLFLYAPILVLVVLSFNASGLPTAWGGFSTRWYEELLRSEDLLDALRTSFVIALAVTGISTVVGTMLALGLERTVRSTVLDTVVFLPAVVPDIVLAIGLLSFFTLARITLGTQTVVMAHVVFDMVFVAAIVRTRLSYFDRSIEEAAQDLGASRVATFFRVTVPVILPGVIAGGLIAFTLSFDEFIIAFFTAGPTVITFPIRIYSMIRFGVTPVVNAVAALILALSFTLILIALRLTRREARRAVER
jgi:spermidine/putrescine transport system permease protein